MAARNQGHSKTSKDWVPILNREFRINGNNIEFDGALQILPRETSLKTLSSTLSKMNGSSAVSELMRDFDDEQSAAISKIVHVLDEYGLIDEANSVISRPGSEVILELEEQMETLCDATIYKNPFWTTCLSAQTGDDLPQQLATGMVIENWHFLFRESYFDAPVLSYVANTEVRLLLNQFFAEEYGHDEILLKSLEYVGFTRADMADSIPLPQTMRITIHSSSL
jgi:hypothetical protein